MDKDRQYINDTFNSPKAAGQYITAPWDTDEE